MISRETSRETFATGSRTEHDLIAAAQRGDIAARNRLVERHLGFIVLMVRRGLRGAEACDGWDEYLSEGVDAFIASVMRFRLGARHGLTCYAGVAITRRVIGARRRMRLIALPRNGMDRMSEESKVAFGAAGRVVFLGSVGMPDARRPFELADRRTGDPASRAERLERSAVLGGLVGALPPLVQRIVRDRAAGMTLEEIGKGVGLTRERVRQIWRKSLDLLREGLDQAEGAQGRGVA